MRALVTLLMPFLDQIVTALIAFTLGGGFWKVMQARAESRARHAEANAIGAKSGPEVADISVSTLVKVNQQLTADYERMRTERDDYSERFAALRAAFDELQAQLDRTQADLQTANDALETLRQNLDSITREEPEHE